jgi:FkbM family methyltransferase
MKYKILKYLKWLQQFGVGGLKRIMFRGDAGAGWIVLKSSRYGNICCRNCLEDLEAINTVLIFDAYHVQDDYKNCKTILDLGANIGIATKYFCNQIPAAHIVAVEPSEQNCIIYRRNLEEEIKAGRAKLLHGAIGVAEGTGYFEAGENIRFDSFKVVKNEAGVKVATSKHEQVQIIGIGDLVERLERPLLVKVDIEGAEHDLLNSRSKWANAVDCLMIEFHVRSQERFWVETLTREGWRAMKFFDTWHFTKAGQ